MADLSAIRSLVLDVNLLAHGVDVTVTRPAPDDEPIVTRGIWMTTETEGMPIGSEFPRRDQRRVMALSRAAVATVPLGTLIVAPEKSGNAVRAWRVDGFERQEADHNRVVVIDVTDA